jgi:hypothetical protein
MLRITRVTNGASSILLKVEGWIVAEWVPLLEHEIVAGLQVGKSVDLDFEGVSYIDGAGIRMLQAISSNRLQIMHCSAFIQALLDQRASPE